MLGAHTKSSSLYVITEYCPHGNLRNFLETRRDIFQDHWFKNEQDMEKELTYVDLCKIILQVARGMDYLAAKKVCTNAIKVDFWIEYIGLDLNNGKVFCLHYM